MMEILSSGSFITLDGREKIEQLIFTAKELAKAASQSEGFVNAGPSNQSLALEMWRGTEYMCRGHEEATIKNIFLSNFLQNLREIGLQKPSHKTCPTEYCSMSVTRFERPASRAMSHADWPKSVCCYISAP